MKAKIMLESIYILMSFFLPYILLSLVCGSILKNNVSNEVFEYYLFDVILASLFVGLYCMSLCNKYLNNKHKKAGS